MRYGGDTLQLGLPFISTEKEIDLVVNAIGESRKDRLNYSRSAYLLPSLIISLAVL